MKKLQECQKKRGGVQIRSTETSRSLKQVHQPQVLFIIAVNILITCQCDPNKSNVLSLTYICIYDASTMLNMHCHHQATSQTKSGQLSVSNWQLVSREVTKRTGDRDQFIFPNQKEHKIIIPMQITQKPTTIMKRIY